MVIIYLDVLSYLFFIVIKSIRKKLSFDIHIQIDILITSLMLYLFFSELKMYYILNYELRLHSLPIRSQIINLAMYKLSHLSKRSDLLIGSVYSIVCLKALPKSKFTEIITHIMLTFQRSLADLTGFFVVFVFFLISYSFELHYLLGEHFWHFSTLTKCFAALFRLIWGDIDFKETTNVDWKSFYFFLSYLMFMIIIMFNLMLAIILGTYDSVKNDPTCRGAYYRLDEYILILFDRYLKSNKKIYSLLLKFTNIKSKLGLFCLHDIEKRLRAHFDQEQIDHIFKMYKLKRSEQVDKFKTESLIRNMFQLDFNSKPKLRINDHYLAGDYVSNAEWRKLTNEYDELETFSALFERRLDVVCDSLLSNLNNSSK